MSETLILLFMVEFLLKFYHVTMFLNVMILFTGRQVAIDWAVPKDKFIATQPTSSAGKFQHFSSGRVNNYFSF